MLKINLNILVKQLTRKTIQPPSWGLFTGYPGLRLPLGRVSCYYDVKLLLDNLNLDTPYHGKAMR